MDEAHDVRVLRYPDGTMLQLLEDGSTRPLAMDGETDWERLRTMTDEEVEANALDDPDSPPLPPEAFAEMAEEIDLAKVRAFLGLSQEAFAARFGLALDDLRAWERAYRPRVVTTDCEPVLRTSSSNASDRLE